MAVNERATQQSHYFMNAFIYELVKIAKQQHRKVDQWLPGQALQRERERDGLHLPWWSSSRLHIYQPLEKVFMVYTIYSINKV